jgi:MFS family permease
VGTTPLERAAVPPSFGLLVAGYSCSAYGNYLNLIALSLYTYAVTGSPLGIGVVMALRLAAGFCAGLVAGALVNRFDRRRLMICTDVGQALAMVALAMGTPEVVPLGCVAVVLGAGNTLFTVALRSSVPEMVGADARVRANGWLVSGRSAGTVLGFASAGVIVSAGGFTTAFLVNAASFLVSAAALARLRLRTRAAGAEPGTAAKPARRWPLAGLAPLLAALVVVRGVDALSSASHNMALPVHAGLLAPADPAVLMSQFWASWAVGSLLAHQLVRRLPGLLPRGDRAFALGTCLMSVCFVLAFTGPPWPVLVLVAGLAGLADGTTEILYTSRLQAAPDDERGRLFGLSATAETAGFAIGMLASSALLEVLAPLAVVAAFHSVALLLAAGLLVVLLLRRRTTEPVAAQGEHG